MKPKFKIGMTAPEVVAEIARIHPNITAMGFYTYSAHQGVREKLQKSDNITISELLFHDETRPSILLGRTGLTSTELTNLLPSDGDLAVAVISRVEIGGDYSFHIPMVDFCCEQSQKNLEAIKDFLYQIGQQAGAILASGRSYHYYGTRLFREKRMREFLAQCLLFTGYVDERYISHRLLDNCCLLRISACSLRPKIPTVVAVL